MISKQAKWIGAPAEFDTCKSPYLRYEFSEEKKVQKAEFMISGLGYYEAWINGRRVGDHVLDPAQTDYEKRVFYVSHDVTRLLNKDENAIGVILGNGWYNQDRVWSTKQVVYDPDKPETGVPETVTGMSYGTPRLLLELKITFADGTCKSVYSDEKWCCSTGPVLDNNIYAGECYDARLELPAWSQYGYDDSDWSKVSLVSAPEGELQKQDLPPIRKIEEIKPVDILKLPSGIAVIDFGQNLSGWIRINVKAPEGSEIKMRFAETISEDGNIDTSTTGTFATGVEQIDRYICKGKSIETWEPKFTYHGFRYVEISGLNDEIEIMGMAAVVVHTDLKRGGYFESSDKRLNKLHEMALWTHRGNIHSIPEDCPARERCGWLGDANLVAEYSMWNYDALTFWEKFLDDIETSRSLNNGIPTNIAPGKRGCNGNANPDWAMAFINLPWFLYLYTGDTEIPKKHWEGMTKLMHHLEKISDNWIVKAGFGDFFDPGTDRIVSHTPVKLTSTLWFFHCSGIMKKLSEVLNLKDETSRYCDWEENIRHALIDKFYDKEKGSFGSQGANTLAIKFGVFDHDEQSRLVTALVEDIREREIHMNVGVMGVRYILEVLSENGHGELALELMHQNSYPSFGNLIERGATTLWECWGEAGHDGTHGPRSLNHPFMGGYDNWFFNTLGGIQIDPDNPGFKHFFISPKPIEGLEWVKAYYDTPLGRIEVSWKNGEEFELEVKIPEGSTATVILPFNNERHSNQSGNNKYCVESK